MSTTYLFIYLFNVNYFLKKAVKLQANASSYSSTVYRNVNRELQ